VEPADLGVLLDRIGPRRTGKVVFFSLRWLRCMIYITRGAV
jgi:hypothetical protein